MNARLKFRILCKLGTQAKLAKTIGRSREYISRVVNEHIRPRHKGKMKIAKALNCRIKDIFNLER